MHWQIEGKEKPIIFILKLLYLIPLQLIIYIFGVIWLGIKESGNPFVDLRESWRDAKKWNANRQ